MRGFAVLRRFIDIVLRARNTNKQVSSGGPDGAGVVDGGGAASRAKFRPSAGLPSRLQQDELGKSDFALCSFIG